MEKKCGVVMQEGFIFSDTIAGNIGLIDEIPLKEKIDRETETANIKEYVESLPLGYNTKIGNDGHGLSTGQKQRILIARAVYKEPDFIFFDEATNALDSRNEKTIMENLGNFFIGARRIKLKSPAGLAVLRSCRSCNLYSLCLLPVLKLLITFSTISCKMF